MQRSILIPVATLAAVAGVVAAVGLGLLPLSRSAGVEAPPDLMRSMTADTARFLLAHDVVVPTAEPLGLTFMMDTRRLVVDGRPVGFESDYHHGGLEMMVCETAAAPRVDTSCDATDAWQVFREETVDGRDVRVATHRGWVVPTTAAEVPSGDRIAEILWWWSTAPLGEPADAGWLADLATSPGRVVSG